MKFFPLTTNLKNLVYAAWPWWISAGLIVAQLQAQLLVKQWLTVIAALAILMIVKRVRSLVTPCFLVAMGLFWGSYWGADTLDRALPKALIKQDVWVIGEIKDLPQQRAHAVKFRFHIDEVQTHDQQEAFDGTVILNWYGKPFPKLAVGQKWRLKVRLKPAHGSMNPGGFDYERYLFSQGIRATGYVRDAKQANLLSEPRLRDSIDSFRAQFKQFIDANSFTLGSVLTALSVGERTTITQAQWKIFRDTGTAHLVAISGLHIGLVAGMAYFLASLLWRHTLLVSTQYPTQHIGRISAVIAALIYAALAGFALPTLRAFLMLLAYFSLQLLRRTPGPIFTLGFVLMVVLIADPLAPLGSGLWLSFGAVLAIMLSLSNARTPTNDERDLAFEEPTILERVKRYFMQWGRMQWAVFIALMPLSLLFFGQFSIVSLLANFIAIPVVGMLVVPLVLIALFWFALGFVQTSVWCLSGANEIMELLWSFLQFLETLPFAAWVGAEPSHWAAAISLIGVLVLLTTKLGNHRILGALGLIPLFVQPNHVIDKNAFNVHVLDVGQGLAVVVRTQNKTLVYDAGIKYSSGFDSGEAIVLPFLNQRGLRSLDAVVVSHNNIDHYGGVGAVVDALNPRVIYASAGFYNSSTPCEQGISWQWDEVQFSFLHPTKRAKTSDNNDSCVLKISSRYGRILLTGDIEKQAERALLNSELNVRAEVLLAPHHGSKSSSSAAFLEAVDPQLVVVSAGFLNRFRHPHKDIIKRYVERKIPYLNTANSGLISLEFTKAGIKATPYRSTKQQYWSNVDSSIAQQIIQPKLDRRLATP